jgi:hypothetical protein
MSRPTRKERAIQQLGERLPELRRHIEYLVITDPALAVLVGRVKQWYPVLLLVADELFVEAVEADMPEYGLRRGQIGVRQDLLHAVLALEAAWVAR